MKKTTAMMAASFMIMSLVLGGCGTTSAATTATASVETEAETQVETEAVQTDAAQDSAEQTDAAQDTEAQDTEASNGYGLDAETQATGAEAVDPPATTQPAPATAFQSWISRGIIPFRTSFIS